MITGVAAVQPASVAAGSSDRLLVSFKDAKVNDSLAHSQRESLANDAYRLRFLNGQKPLLTWSPSQFTPTKEQANLYERMAIKPSYSRLRWSSVLTYSRVPSTVASRPAVTLRCPPTTSGCHCHAALSTTESRHRHAWRRARAGAV